MKHVFKTDMVAHVWAQLTQPDGRTPTNSFWFRDRMLYSYATPVARILSYQSSTGRWRDIVLLSSERYSSSTGRQLNAAAAATRHMTQFHVPYLGVPSEGRYSEPPTDDRTVAPHGLPNAHAGNLAHYRERYAKEAKRLLLQRDSITRELIANRLADIADIAHQYADVFGLDRQIYAITADAERIDAARNSPKRAAARAARAAAWAARNTTRAEFDRLRLVRDAADTATACAAWRETGGRWFGRSLNCPEGGAMIRVDGDTVQTSWGVRDVPLHIARSALMVYFHGDPAQLVGGYIERVSGFKVTRADADKVCIGCHDFYRAELERFAASIGVTTT